MTGIANLNNRAHLSGLPLKVNIVQDTQGSTIFDFGDNFVIATLVSAPRGVASLKVQNLGAAVLKKESKFLIEKAKSAMEGKTDLDAIAAELGTTVKDASNINHIIQIRAQAWSLSSRSC